MTWKTDLDAATQRTDAAKQLWHNEIQETQQLVYDLHYGPQGVPTASIAEYLGVTGGYVRQLYIEVRKRQAVSV